MEHLAHVDTATDELGARCLDVRHDEIKSACRARRGRCDSRAEVDRARRARRRELHDPKLVTDDEVGVEPPTQAAVKALGAIDVRNRDDDDLELHVDRPRSRGLDCSFAAHLGTLMSSSLGLGALRVAKHVQAWKDLSLNSPHVKLLRTDSQGLDRRDQVDDFILWSQWHWRRAGP